MAQWVRGQWALGSQCLWPPMPPPPSLPSLSSPALSCPLISKLLYRSPRQCLHTGAAFSGPGWRSILSCLASLHAEGPPLCHPRCFRSHTVLGGEGGEEDGQTALTQRCVISQVPTTTQPVGARNTLAASESWTMSWRRLQAFQRPHCQHDQGKIPGSLHSSTSRCKGYLLS